MSRFNDDIAVVREALGYYFEDGRDHPRPLLDGTAALDRLEARIAELGEALVAAEQRIAELEIRDKMRDDGERHLLSEIEARDARIAELEDERDNWLLGADELNRAWGRVRELEEALARAVQARHTAEDRTREVAAEGTRYLQRVRDLEKALVDACDVALWLTGLPCLHPGSDAWTYWEAGARAKLYKAMDTLRREEERPCGEGAE